MQTCNALASASGAVVEQQLEASFNRLHFVRIDAEEELWWPCLLYKDFTELQRHVQEKKLKARYSSERFFRHRPCTGKSVARILGDSDWPNNLRLRFVAKEELDDLTLNFLDHELEIEKRYDQVPGWRNAYEKAYEIINAYADVDSLDSDDVIFLGPTEVKVQVDRSPPKQKDSDMQEEGVIASNPFDASREVAFSVSCNAESIEPTEVHVGVYNKDSPEQMNAMDSNNNQTSHRSPLLDATNYDTSMAEPTAQFEIQEEDAPSPESPDDDDQAMAADSIPPFQVEEAASPSLQSVCPAECENKEVDNGPASAESATLSLTVGRTPPSKTIDNNVQDRKEVTPVKATANQSRRRKKPPRDVKVRIDKHMSFDDAWEVLHEKQGWWREKGGGVGNAFYYVTGEHTAKKLSDVMKYCKHGTDYFIGKERLEAYLRERYKWVGTKSSKPQKKKAGEIVGKEEPACKKRKTEKERKTDVANQPLKSNRNRNIVKSPRKEISKNDDFATALDILMHSHNWKIVNSSTSRIGYMYVKGGHTQGGRLTTNLRELTKDEDYFLEEDDVKEYLHKNIGWVGPAGKEFSPSAGRRRRGRTRESPSSASEATTIKKAKKKKVGKDAKKDENSAGSESPSSVEEPSHASPTIEESGSQIESTEKERGVSASLSTSSNKDVESRETFLPKDDVSTLKERLDKCSERLNISQPRTDLLFEGINSSSNFSNTKERILSFLQHCGDTSDFDSGDSSILYICGRPGTGKTTLVQHCLDLSESLQYSVVNGAGVSTQERLFDEISKLLFKKGTSNVPKLEKALSRKSPGSQIVLVIDEINFLWRGLLTKKREKEKDETPLETIFRWASDPAYRFALIGISNSVGDDDAKSLHKIAKVKDEIIFAPYTEDDLVQVIRKRVGSNLELLDEKAVKFVSRRVALESGDCRLVLDLMSKAIIKCKESLAAEKLKEVGVHDTIVKLPHVMKAIKDSGQLPLVQIIDALPQHAKTILCVYTALGQVSSEWKVITVRKLRSYCALATEHSVLDQISSEQFTSLLRQLEDAGTIKFETDDIVNHLGYDECGDQKIRLGVQLEDVECAIGKTLLEERSFYRRLVAHCRNIGAQVG